VLLPVTAAVVVVALAADLHNRPHAFGIDFHTYLAAAMVGIQHGWSQIYDQGLVAVAQKHVVPTLWSQPYISPPLVAWVVAPLSAVPYGAALDIWMAITLGALLAALIWSTDYRGWDRALLVAAAMVPWWVLHSVQVGQVVPLVAAGLIVAWRLLRDRRDVAAGIVLGVILLKPNTALWVPLVLLVAGRAKAFTAWLAVAAMVGVFSLIALGQSGLSAYLHDLSRLPNGANDLTLNGTFGLGGAAAMIVRVAIILGALVTAYRLRSTPGLAIAVGALASLITSPYLHGSDLCVFLAAGWMTWHEREAPAWRAMLTAMWFFATPFVVFDIKGGALLNRWAVAELVLFLAILLNAWFGALVSRWTRRALTTPSDLGRQAAA